MAYYVQSGNKSYGEDKSNFPAPVKVNGFYTSDGKIIPDLFDSKALEIAKSLIGTDRNGRTVGVTSTQLRKLFDEVKRYEQILSTGSDQWDKQLPYIKMIKSKTAYTVARAIKTKPAEEKVYKNLESFISSSIDNIQKEADFSIFVSLFEAAYGFYYEMAPKNCQ